MADQRQILTEPLVTPSHVNWILILTERPDCPAAVRQFVRRMPASYPAAAGLEALLCQFAANVSRSSITGGLDERGAVIAGAELAAEEHRARSGGAGEAVQVHLGGRSRQGDLHELAAGPVQQRWIGEGRHPPEPAVTVTGHPGRRDSPEAIRDDPGEPRTQFKWADWAVSLRVVARVSSGRNLPHFEWVQLV